jgi:alpha/beta superfamily hydrolase
MARIERLPPPPAQPVRSPPVAVAGEVETRIGGIEARVHVPPGARRAVVLCHPHPLYGGSMHSPVPLALAKTLADRAADTAAWARFNFRGVGASAGTYDGGQGEVDDARAVIEHLRAAAPGAPVSVAGHSFGSWVGLRAAAAADGVVRAPRRGSDAHGKVDRVLLVAPSVRFFELREDAFRFDGPKLVFIGDRDEFCDVDEARDLAARLGAEAALPFLVPEASRP